jgi:hypothetical protein
MGDAFLVEISEETKKSEEKRMQRLYIYRYEPYQSILLPDGSISVVTHGALTL